MMVDYMDQLIFLICIFCQNNGQAESFQQWGAIIRLVALLVPVERKLVLFVEKIAVKNTNTVACHSGPVQPPSGEGLKDCDKILLNSKIQKLSFRL